MSKPDSKLSDENQKVTHDPIKNFCFQGIADLISKVRENSTQKSLKDISKKYPHLSNTSHVTHDPMKNFCSQGDADQSSEVKENSSQKSFNDLSK